MARTRKLAAGVILAVVITLFSPAAFAAPAADAADDDPTPAPRPADDGPVPDEHADDRISEVEAVARDLKISQADARLAMELSLELDALQVQAARTYPKTFAGLWMETKPEVAVVAAFTEPSAGAATLLENRFARPGLVSTTPAKFSLRELQSVVEALDRDHADLTAEGVQFAHYGVDVRRNKVEIVVDDITDPVLELLNERYGEDRIAVSEGEQPVATQCTRRACDDYPWRAGLYVYGDDWACSSAFSAFRGGREASKGH